MNHKQKMMKAIMKEHIETINEVERLKKENKKLNIHIGCLDSEFGLKINIIKSNSNEIKLLKEGNNRLLASNKKRQELEKKNLGLMSQVSRLLAEKNSNQEQDEYDKSLTEYSKKICKCGHRVGQHSLGGYCTVCKKGCPNVMDEFKARHNK